MKNRLWIGNKRLTMGAAWRRIKPVEISSLLPLSLGEGEKAPASSAPFSGGHPPLSVVFLAVWLCALAASAQTLNLPARSASAPTGTEFVNQITPLSLTDRENAIYAQISNGNVPNWLRTLVLVSTNASISNINHTVSYYVTPDYLAIGSDLDYFLCPMTPLLAQRVANLLNCSLPTRKMVNDIWKQAPCHLAPSPIAPGPAMTTVPVFHQHNTTVRGQRMAVTNTHPLGTLTGGDKKDVVISVRIYTNFASQFITKPVVIYGWHQTNGVNIQGVYNGHEETYADYSHGLRLVPMNITVDGAAHTVTNVLTNPALAALLSDETTYPANVVPKPRYTISPSGPAITTQPYSRTVSLGENVNFTLVASGTAPLRYQWQFNGSPLAGATNATLTLADAQPSRAGQYTAIVSNNEGAASSIPAALKVNTTFPPILFADDFETNSAANWNLFWGSGNGVPDYTVAWAFHYGTNPYTFNGATYLIPPAPNSGSTTRGVKFTVNNDSNGVTAGVNIYPKNQSFSGNYALKCDMWINYPGGSGGTGTGVTGSTEHGIFGLNHLGTNVNWAATAATASDGIWFGATGEGGTAKDYRAYVGNLSGVPTELIGPTSGLAESNNAAGIYPTLFPGSRFESAGAPGKQWVSVELRQVNNVISWKMDGTVIGQRTNTSAFTSGNIMLGFMDAFPSIAAPAKDAFIIFDNVQVEDLTESPQQPPAITSPPQDQSCHVGADVSFSVAATGTAPLKYQWFFNGAALADATNMTLHLRAVQTSEAGPYSVTASNSAGFASATATLFVNSSASHFESVTKQTNGQVGFTFLGIEGESYLLEASTNLQTWQPISVLPGGSSALPFVDPASPSFFFRFYRAISTASQLLTDFESFAPGSTVLFQRPSISPSTTNYIDLTAGNFAFVTNIFPAGHESEQVLAVAWTFKPPVTTNSWLRLTTFNTANLPNPTVGFNQAIRFDIFADREVYVTLGLRETSTTAAIGADGGTTNGIEWIGGTTANSHPPQGRLVAANQWTALHFFIPLEPIRLFAGTTANGILESATGRGVLEHLCLVPAAGAGAYTVYLDNFQVAELTP